MTNPAADRNLLFGILALQMDAITRDALIAAMNDWVIAKHRPLGEILIERKALDPLDREEVERRVNFQIARHAGDAQACLVALSSAGAIASDLRRSISADGQLLAWLDSWSNRRAHDPDATRLSVPPSPHLSLAKGDTYATKPGTTPINEPFDPDATADPSDPRFSVSDDPFLDDTRFRKVHEHAAGNLGVVFVAQDQELNRKVALKEIKQRNSHRSDQQAKFVLEAEVTGGLEHPGIVPVYGMGKYDDGRPYYAMRFIRGKSLLKSIEKFHANDTLKADPGKRLLALQRLLRRFTDVCNAMAYAHSRGVLHRDLKPENIMVGKYGETLVVDWGLARTLGESVELGAGEPHDEDHEDHLPEESLQPTSLDGEHQDYQGQIIGTPAYMSPEQAAGHLDRLGPASDIYGLGATLYHLLVGRIAIEAATLEEFLDKVKTGQLTRPRAIAPWLDPALEAICLKAMALDPADRYQNPRNLAADLDRWIAGEPVTAYPEPWTRKARRWAKKHRTALATTGSAAIVAAVLLGWFTWNKIVARQKIDASAIAMIQSSERLENEGGPGDSARWSKAAVEARRAVDLLGAGGSPELLQMAKARLKTLETEKTMIEAIEVARLEREKLNKNGYFDVEAAGRVYLAAFQAYGIDLVGLSVEDAAHRIRTSKLADDLISTLEEWGLHPPKAVPQSRMKAILLAADDDPIRATVRDAVTRRDADFLRRLCEREADRRKLGPRLRSIFNALASLDPSGSFPLLETIRRENPSDFWYNHDLGMAYKEAKPPRLAEATRCLSVSVGLRPESPGAHCNLGLILQLAGDIDAAMAENRIAIRLDPRYPRPHTNLGLALKDRGFVDEAIAECRLAVEMTPEDWTLHVNLGYALMSKDIAAAIAELQAAVRLNPSSQQAHYGLGDVMKVKGDLDGAIAEYRTALAIDPEYAIAHSNLACALVLRGNDHESIVESEAAIRLDPENPDSHLYLGIGLMRQQKIDRAIEEFRKAIHLNPKYLLAYGNLGNALSRKGDHDGAIGVFREAARLDPRDPRTYFNIGNELSKKGDLDGAIASYRETIRVDPNYAEAHCKLGLNLEQQGRRAEALAPLERGHEIGSKQPGWRFPSEQWLKKCRRLVAAELKLPTILKGGNSPEDLDELLGLAELCSQEKLAASSARFFNEAFARKRELANDVLSSYRYDAARSASLAGSGQGKDDPMPDEAARLKLRDQALEWLKADLLAWGTVLDGGNEPARKQAVAKTLTRWKEDADLAGIRDPVALEKLPEGEREKFRALWSEVEALLKRAKGE